jgi:hypothetical protein
MQSWLKAFGIFALMVAAPFVIERLLGGNSRLPGAGRIGAFPWNDALTYAEYTVISIAVLAAIIGGVIFYYKTEEVSELLTLAEREMTSQLRGWGGGMSADARKGMAKERGEWLQMVGDKGEVGKLFFDLNQSDLSSGGPQAAAMGKARLTAFLLRELYEGNVETAQLKVYNEFKNGGKPVIVAGLRQLIDFDKFDEKTGFPHGSGVNPNLLWFAVKIHRHPHHIVMVKGGSDGKKEVKNWEVINELNRQTL